MAGTSWPANNKLLGLLPDRFAFSGGYEYSPYKWRSSHGCPAELVVQPTKYLADFDLLDMAVLNALQEGPSAHGPNKGKGKSPSSVS